MTLASVPSRSIIRRQVSYFAFRILHAKTHACSDILLEHKDAKSLSLNRDLVGQRRENNISTAL
jgi:hypothetical protein